MSELDTQNKDQQAPQDPIARLHKMSTTAGVAAQDYVAINTLAVVAAVLGVATSLAFVGNYFLVIALGAVVCGIVSLRRISDSSGTEGGRPLAWAGIVIALAITGIIIANGVRLERQHEAERGCIRQVIQQLGQDIAAGEYDKAYALYDPAFQKTWTLAQFRSLWQMHQDPAWGFGKVLEMKDNGIISFPTTTADRPVAWTIIVARCQQLPMRRNTTLVLGEDGQWRISDMPEIFRQERQR